LATDRVALESASLVTQPDMSGNGSKIEIFKPFGEAFELMKRILFQRSISKNGLSLALPHGWPAWGVAAAVLTTSPGAGEK